MKNLLFAILLFLPSIGIGQTADIQVESDEWHLLSFPTNLLDIQVHLQFEQMWNDETYPLPSMFAFLGTEYHGILFENQVPYRLKLANGLGFWFKHRQDDPVLLSSINRPIPPGTIVPNPDGTCDPSIHCSNLPLIDAGWYTLGNPYDAPISIPNDLFFTHNIYCAQGCNLEDAVYRDIVGPSVWAYNTTTKEYVSVKGADVNAWDGFWVKILREDVTVSIRNPHCAPVSNGAHWWGNADRVG